MVGSSLGIEVGCIDGSAVGSLLGSPEGCEVG